MDVKTSMIEMHLLNHGRLGVRSPANLVYQHEHVEFPRFHGQLSCHP
jgi:hypothetical protein